MLDLVESGRQIGEKLFALLTAVQKKIWRSFVLERETNSVNSADTLHFPILRGKYSIPKKANQPFTEVREGDLYFCLEQRLVKIRGRVIELTVKELEIFSLLILNPKRCFRLP